MTTTNKVNPKEAVEFLRNQLERKAKVTNFRKRPSIKCFVGGTGKRQWASCSGITEALRLAFYPMYDHRGAKREGLYGSQLALAKQPFRRDPKRECRYKKRKTKGMELGRKIDGQLRRMINGEGLPVKRPEPIARDMFDAQLKWGWIPLASQLPCVMPAIRYGTLIDEMALDRDGGFVLVENKVGFLDYMHLSRGKMHGPLSQISDCPLNQHFIQLAFMKMMLERIHKIPLASCWVVQGTASGVTPYRLPEWAIQKGDAMWKYFCEFVKK